MKQAKEASLRRGCSLGEVIEDALLISLLAKAKDRKAVPVVPIKTYGGAGLQPGVDLSSSAALLEVMERP